MDYLGYIESTLGVVISYLPKIAGAIIILLIGWIVGRLLGKYVSKFLDKIGVDDALLKTAVGQAIEKSGTTVVKFFDILIRWFIYLIAIMAAANVLEIEFLSEFIQMIVQYIPSILAFLVILIVGFLLIDFLVDFLEHIGEAGGVAFMKVIMSVMRLFLYFVVLILALTQLKLDMTIIYIFIEPLAWGIALGIGAAIAIIVGFGLKDRSPELLDNLLKQVKKK